MNLIRPLIVGQRCDPRATKLNTALSVLTLIISSAAMLGAGELTVRMLGDFTDTGFRIRSLKPKPYRLPKA